MHFDSINNIVIKKLLVLIILKEKILQKQIQRIGFASTIESSYNKRIKIISYIFYKTKNRPKLQVKTAKKW